MGEWRFTLLRSGIPHRLDESIEGDSWQARREPDALIFGMSLQTRREILLNTLHIAKPDDQTTAELDKVFFITTYPAR